MKIKEMQDICKEHKGICKDCPLCLPDKTWQQNLISWCMIDYRNTSIFNYEKAKKDKNEKLAEQIMKDYQEKESNLNLKEVEKVRAEK